MGVFSHPDRLDFIMTTLDVIGVVLMILLWIGASWIVWNFFRTECLESHQPKFRTNLDLLFDSAGAATPKWKKALVATPLILGGPITIILFAAGFLIVMTLGDR
jgi:hypothetical protein